MQEFSLSPLVGLTYKFVEYPGLVEELKEEILLLASNVRDQGHCLYPAFTLLLLKFGLFTTTMVANPDQYKVGSGF